MREEGRAGGNVEQTFDRVFCSGCTDSDACGCVIAGKSDDVQHYLWAMFGETVVAYLGG